MDTSELRFGSVQNLYLELETLPLTELFRSHLVRVPFGGVGISGGMGMSRGRGWYPPPHTWDLAWGLGGGGAGIWLESRRFASCWNAFFLSRSVHILYTYLISEYYNCESMISIQCVNADADA